MQLQVGKKYRTRGGWEATVQSRCGGRAPYYVCHSDGPERGGKRHPVFHYDNGVSNISFMRADWAGFDLIAEIADETPTSSEGTPIVADTSRYTNAIDRARALILCKEAQDVGKGIEVKRLTDNAWAYTGRTWDFSCTTLDYRVKPEPVRSTRTEYRVYVVGSIEPVETCKTRSEAVDACRGWCGAFEVREVTIYEEDGKKVGSVEGRADGGSSITGIAW